MVVRRGPGLAQQAPLWLRGLNVMVCEEANASGYQHNTLAAACQEEGLLIPGNTHARALTTHAYDLLINRTAASHPGRFCQVQTPAEHAGVWVANACGDVVATAWSRSR